MTNSQLKKKRAHIFNMERAERLAGEMDRKLFPVPKARRRQGMDARMARSTKVSLMALIALSSGIAVNEL